MNKTGIILSLLCIAVGTATAQPLGSSVEEMKLRLDSRFRQCTEQTGYEAAMTDFLGAYQLGENEREWRGCVYDGIRELIIPNVSAPRLYEELIEADIRMTNDIAAGALSRAERYQRLDELIRGLSFAGETVEPGTVTRRAPAIDSTPSDAADYTLRRELDTLYRSTLINGFGR